jgi:hypothetical protein
VSVPAVLPVTEEQDEGELDVTDFEKILYDTKARGLCYYRGLESVVQRKENEKRIQEREYRRLKQRPP